MRRHRRPRDPWAPAYVALGALIGLLLFLATWPYIAPRPAVQPLPPYAPPTPIPVSSGLAHDPR